MNRRRTSRWLLGALCAACAVIVGTTPIPIVSAQSADPSGQSVSTGKVEWKVLEASKEIQVSVKLVFFADYGDAEIDQATLQRTVDRITTAITAEWNGQPFGCYRLKVVLSTRIEKPGAFNRAYVPPDEVDKVKGEIPVRLSSQLLVLSGAAKAVVWGDGALDAYTSDDPGNRFDPYDAADLLANDGRLPVTTFSMIVDDGTFAHEFGHILGLDDSYEFVNGNKQLREGAEPDLMYSSGQHVSAVSVARAVRRSGLDESLLHCAYRYEVPRSLIFPYTPGNEIEFDWTLCDVPAISGDPALTASLARSRPFSGVTTGGFNFGKLGSASGGGLVQGTYTYEQSVGGGGEVVFRFDLEAGTLVQRAVWLDGTLVAIDSPVLEGSALPVLGSPPTFTVDRTPQDCP